MRYKNTLMISALVLPALALAGELPNDQFQANTVQVAEGNSTNKSNDPATTTTPSATGTQEQQNDLTTDSSRPATGQGPDDPGTDITGTGQERDFDSALTNGDFAPSEDEFVMDATGNRIPSEDLMDTGLVTTNGEDVGEIEQLLVDRDGRIAAVVVDVGGFLGIGERTVAIDWNEIDLRQDGNDGEYQAHVNMDRNAIENAPEFDSEGLYN